MFGIELVPDEEVKFVEYDQVLKDAKVILELNAALKEGELPNLYQLMTICDMCNERLLLEENDPGPIVKCNVCQCETDMREAGATLWHLIPLKPRSDEYTS